jgi:hypothetical protein
VSCLLSQRAHKVGTSVPPLILNPLLSLLAKEALYDFYRLTASTPQREMLKVTSRGKAFIADIC